MPKLLGGNQLMNKQDMKRNIINFINHTGDGEPPEFWAFYSSYDWVALCQLYGTMMDLPGGWPMFCNDLKQLMGEVGVEIVDSRNIHGALAEAEWCKNTYEYLEKCRV